MSTIPFKVGEFVKVKTGKYAGHFGIVDSFNIGYENNVNVADGLGQFMIAAQDLEKVSQTNVAYAYNTLYVNVYGGSLM